MLTMNSPSTLHIICTRLLIHIPPQLSKVSPLFQTDPRVRRLCRARPCTATPSTRVSSLRSASALAAATETTAAGTPRATCTASSTRPCCSTITSRGREMRGCTAAATIGKKEQCHLYIREKHMINKYQCIIGY
jgi:hypothetical protein